MQYPVTPATFTIASGEELNERQESLLGQICKLINIAHDEGVEEGKKVATR